MDKSQHLSSKDRNGQPAAPNSMEKGLNGRGEGGASADLKTSSLPGKDAGLLQDLKNAFRVFLWVAIPILLWLGCGYFALIEDRMLSVGNLIISVLLFVLALPFSAIFRLDSIMSAWAGPRNNEAALLAGLIFVWGNFEIIGAYLGWRKRFLHNPHPQSGC